MKATTTEQKAIDSLERIAKKWPKTLWLFVDGNSVNIMRCGDNGEHVTRSGGGMDPDYIVDSVDIDSDGGDW